EASFVLGLYEDVLGRTQDSVGAASWVQGLSSGITRAQVTRAFLTSDEFYIRTLNGYYLNILHRPADQAGEQWWLGQLRSSQATIDSAAEAFFASSELLAWSSLNGGAH